MIRHRAKHHKHSHLFTLIDTEIILGIHCCNGENNDKYTKDSKYKHYESAARTMLRMMWFTDFLVFMFEKLCNDRNCYTSTALSEAYEKAFGKHHSWLIRTGAKAAMFSCPNRKDLLVLMVGEDKDEEYGQNIMKKLLNVLKPLRETLWEFY